MKKELKKGNLLRIKHGKCKLAVKRIFAPNIDDNLNDIIYSPNSSLKENSIVLLLEDGLVSPETKKIISTMRGFGTKVLYKNKIGYIIINKEDEIL